MAFIIDMSVWTLYGLTILTFIGICFLLYPVALYIYLLSESNKGKFPKKDIFGVKE